MHNSIAGIPFIVDDAFNYEWSGVHECEFGMGVRKIVGAENLEVLLPDHCRLIFD